MSVIAAGWRSLVPALAGLALLALAAAPAAAIDDPGGPERILDFDARIAVETDGSAEVVETITVVARGDQIRRGIFRDIVVAVDSDFGRSTASLDVEGVTRDGEDEPYAVEREGDTRRIRIGSGDVFLDEGVHVYEIRYRFSDAVDFLPDYDELYWNVTGPNWAFPIERVQAEVRLPPGATVLQSRAYSGSFGAASEAASTTRPSPGTIVFETTAPLAAYEGLTIGVGFPKGFVREPTAAEKFLAQAWPAFVAGGGLFVVLAYFLWAWLRVGVDPPAGPIIPVYAPNLPPAAMRFLEKRRADGTGLAAALLDLAVKGHLTIAEGEDGTLALTRKTDGPRMEASTSEAAVLAALFPTGSGTVQLGRTSEDKRLASTEAAMGKFLNRKLLGENIRSNLGWYAVGAVLTVLSWVAVVVVSPASEELIGGAVAGIITTVIGALLGPKLLQQWREVRDGQWLSLFPAMIASLFLVPIAAGFLVSLVALIGAVGLAAAVLLIATVVVNVVFFRLLPAPTAVGRAALDEIEGTRLYLSVAEADRLKFHNPPDRTLAHFEAMLPYAVALDLATPWTERFKDLLAASAATAAAAGAVGGGGWHPGWYSGGRGGGLPSDFGSSFGSRIRTSSQAGARAIAAAAARASGRSGSSGGGFSGGGRGGGGGGGW
jgi:uncharacterized membrane protein YeaQ/YmgE (transglycosylase-associated protein family)